MGKKILFMESWHECNILANILIQSFYRGYFDLITIIFILGIRALKGEDDEPEDEWKTLWYWEYKNSISFCFYIYKKESWY